jgi:hypothetical protein
MLFACPLRSLQVVSLVVLVMGALPDRGQAGKILVDFGVSTLEVRGADEAGRFWNSASLPPGAVASSVTFADLPLVDEKGSRTPLNLKVTDPFLGAFDSGDNRQELYPNAVGKDRWSLEKGKKDSAALLLTGLDPSQSYDFHFFGVRDAPITFVTQYTVNGKSVTLAAQNNRSNLGSVTQVIPNSDGTVKIDVAIAEGPNAHLSAMEITWAGDKPTQRGQFASFYQKSVPAPPTPAVVAKPSPPPPAPTTPKTSTSPPSSSTYTPPVKKPSVSGAPVLSKSQTVTEKSKGPLIAGILLLLAGLGVGGFSGYKLFGR